jgi:hypothetical protein
MGRPNGMAGSISLAQASRNHGETWLTNGESGESLTARPETRRYFAMTTMQIICCGIICG